MMSTRKNRSKQVTVATTFGEHVKELRARTFLVAIVFFVLSLVAYTLREPLIKIVLAPIGEQKLIYLTPAGGFGFIFSVTMYAALVVTVPFLLYQVYQFVKPTLPPKAKRYSLHIFVAALVLMGSGVLFGYFVAVPSALTFLTHFAGEFVTPNLTADSYLNFFLAYVAGLGLLFQLPLLLLFWNWISPIKPGGLLNSQRYVIAGSFIVAAMITPTPDIFNQTLVAGPIIAIYQLGVAVVVITNYRARKARRVSARTTSPTAPVPKAVSPSPVVPPAAPRLRRPQPSSPERKVIVPPPRRARSIDGVSTIRRSPTYR